MEETKKNKLLFEVSCEVDACDKSNAFFFGDRTDHAGDGLFNWLGMLYVMAVDESHAKDMFESYLKNESKSWRIESGPKQIAQIDHAMHVAAIRARKDEDRLAAGSVVEGWGF